MKMQLSYFRQWQKKHDDVHLFKLIQFELDQAITLYLSKARDLCWMDFSQHGLKWKLMPYRKSDVSLAKKFDPIISEVQVKHKESNIEKA